MGTYLGAAHALPDPANDIAEQRLHVIVEFLLDDHRGERLAFARCHQGRGDQIREEEGGRHSLRLVSRRHRPLDARHARLQVVQRVQRGSGGRRHPSRGGAGRDLRPLGVQQT